MNRCRIAHRPQQKVSRDQAPPSSGSTLSSAPRAAYLATIFHPLSVSSSPVTLPMRKGTQNICTVLTSSKFESLSRSCGGRKICKFEGVYEPCFLTAPRCVKRGSHKGRCLARGFLSKLQMQYYWEGCNSSQLSYS